MAEVKRSIIVPYSVEQMYALVADIERYGEFLPGCAGAEVLERDGEKVRARVDIAFKGVGKGFTTRNRLLPNQRIEMDLETGPFRRLHGQWVFTPLGERGCKVTLDLEYEFASRVLALALGPVFDKFTNSMVDAFVERARRTYGNA